LQFSTDRNHEISRDFSLIDRNGDRSISWEDIVVLSEEAGDKVSGEVAKTMVLHASKKGIISQATFAELFQPHKL
jgi:Ca2+-binding EF-hand superfamily protein